MSERVPAIKVLSLPKDTNRVAPHRYVTKATASAKAPARLAEAERRRMREVEFHAPVFVGVLVNFFTETTRVGHTSVTVKVLVEVERWSGGHGEHLKVTEADVVLVAIGSDGRRTAVRPGEVAA